MKRLPALAAATVLISMAASAAQATAFRLLLESDTDAGAGAEVFLASFATFDDLLGATTSQTGFSQIDIGGNFSAGGLAYEAQFADPDATIPVPASGPLLLLCIGLLVTFRRRAA